MLLQCNCINKENYSYYFLIINTFIVIVIVIVIERKVTEQCLFSRLQAYFQALKSILKNTELRNSAKFANFTLLNEYSIK